MKHIKDFTRQKQRHRKYSRSQKQIKRQKKFQFCCDFWKRFVTKSQKENWKTFSIHKETAFNSFLRINLVRTFNDLPILSSPPE